MKVNVYSKNGVLLKEFGTDPGVSCKPGVRTVDDCEQAHQGFYKIRFDDGLLPETGYVFGDVTIVTY